MRSAGGGRMGAIADAALSVAGLYRHPYAAHFAAQAVEFTELCTLSQREPEEVKAIARAWPGTLRSLRQFYARYGCFPSEL